MILALYIYIYIMYIHLYVYFKKARNGTKSITQALLGYTKQIKRSHLSIPFVCRFLPIFTHNVSTLLQWKALTETFFPSTAAVLTSGWQQVNCSENVRGHFPFVVLLRLLDSI